MNRKLLLALLALVMLPLASARAGWRIGFGFGYPPYYRPYRVVIAPGPIYVATPGVVYAQPAPVYYYTQPTYVQPAPGYYIVPPPPPSPVAVQPSREMLPPQAPGR